MSETQSSIPQHSPEHAAPYGRRLFGRLTMARLRTWSGMTIGIYVLLHLLNHSLGLVSVHAQESARPWVMGFWHSWPGQVLLYGSLIVHSGIGLSTLIRRRHYRMPLWEGLQILLGLAIPYLLLVHITNTRGTRILTGIEIDYTYEIANLWVNPWVRTQQVILVLLVWGHFVMGLHFWLRNRPAYRRAFTVIVLGYVLVPFCGLLGFAHVGMGMTERSQAHPEWYQELKVRGVPSDPGRAQVRAALKQWAGPVWLALVGVVFVAGRLNYFLNRHRRINVTYPDRDVVPAPIGMSLLEVSRMAHRPHMSVCGGRGRCTTCRVWVKRSDGPLQPPGETEKSALLRIGAPASLRLACQLRPAFDVTIHPMLNPNLGIAGPRGAVGSHEFGEERVVSVLFMDVRGSTKLAEGRLPFDVVFLLNHFFAEMSAAVEDAGGHYSNFTGDGLMALFGLSSSTQAGARAALACALGMFEKLNDVNGRLAEVLNGGLSIGIGIHTGEAIVGRMGPPKTPIISALGDAVNTTARLEGMTKELNAPIVISLDTLCAAGVEDGIPIREISLRGRETPIQVAALDTDALALSLLSIVIEAPPGSASRG